MGEKIKRVMLSNIFSGLSPQEKFKMYRKLWEQASKYEVLTDFPLHLDIELAGICNLKCKHCFQNGLISSSLGLMDYGLFQKIIDEGAINGLCAVKLQVRGESFLNPKIFECIDYAKSSGILDVQITTNGAFLDEERMQKILDCGLDGIVLTVDEHHEEGFRERLKRYKYSPIELSINKFLQLKNKLGKSKPWVRLQASIPQSDMVSMRREKNYLKSKFPEADIIVINRIRDFREDVPGYPDLHVNYELLPCERLMCRLAILWDGEIVICCVDYNNLFKLGNLKNQKIQKIWLSEKMDKFRATHLAGNRKTMPICKNCDACTISLLDRNAVDNTPRHIAEHTLDDHRINEVF